MNDDTNLHPWIEPELEARLAALVLGEASDFERDELERLVADRPELGLYRKRLEAMHRMLREVATGESAEEHGEWKLSPERRTAVLARLRGEEKAEEKVVVMSESKRRVPWGMIFRVAACVMVAALALGLMYLVAKPEHLGVADEGSKLNTNTHAGGLAWDVPQAVDDFDRIGEKYPPAQHEWQRYPGSSTEGERVDRDAQELALADRAIRLPAPTSATPAPPAEPMVVTRSGQIGALKGTVAIGAGGDIALGIDPNSPGKVSVTNAGNSYTNVRVGGGFDGRVVESPSAAEMPVASTLGGENSYTGGTEISAGGGALAITGPELAASDKRGTVETTASTVERQLAENSAEIRSLERERKELEGAVTDDRAERGQTSAGSTIASTSTAFSSSEVPEIARDLSNVQGLKSASSMTMSGFEFNDTEGAGDRGIPQQDGFRLVGERESSPYEFGTTDITLGEPVTEINRDLLPPQFPAPAASPKPVASAPVSGPTIADPETRLKKQGAGTLALNGGTVDLGLSNEVVEVDGFIDHKQKTDAPQSAPSAGENLNFTGDLQVNGGVEAKVNAAKEAVTLGSGGMIAGVSGQEGREGFGNESPAELDSLSRSAGSGVTAGQEGDVSRMGRSVAVEKSMSQQIESEVKRESTGDWGKASPRKAPIDETVDLGGEISAGYMSDYIFYGTRFQADGKNGAVNNEGIVNFGTAVSQIENLGELQKTGDANVALPGLQPDKQRFRFTVQAGSQRKDADLEIDEPWRFGRAGEVDPSVADIMALTPQVEKDLSQDRDKMEMLYQVVPRIVGGGSESGTRIVDSDSPESKNGQFPSLDDVVMREGREKEKIRSATFYDVGEVTDGPTAANSDFGIGTKLFILGSAPVRLDYGVPIGDGSETSETFKFRLGATMDAPASTKPSERPALRQPTPAALDETSPSAEPFSTFSLHVSDVSFQLAKSSLASGKWPEAEKIRIEEFVNAFDYGDPVPSMGERVACRIDQGAHPFLQQRNLVRIALRTAEAGRSSGTPLRLTLLLDSSGSMERPDRRATLTRAVATLAGLLGENDRITLVSFARQPRLVADAVAGNEAMKLAETVAALPSEGGTNLEAALELAFEKAREHQEANAQNRIVLLTDGAANLGDAKAESLGARVELMRDAGIAFDAAGFGAEGLNDEILEALTRKGDGRYYLLDRPEDAGEAFAEQIAGALRPAAKNVKVQVEFNPDRVKSYKLLGFEKHRLATEDFRNDAVDAAELAAAEAGVAVYQVEPDPAGEGDLGSVSVRFRDLESGEMVERRWSLPHLATAPAADQGGGATHLAIVASQFAAKLAGGPLGDVVDLGELARLAATLPDSPRVDELRTMIEQARGLEGDR